MLNNQKYYGPEAAGETDDIRANRWYAALSYVWILSIVFLILKNKSQFVAWHAKQALVMAALLTFLWWGPFLGWPVFGVSIVILEIIGFNKARQGKFWQAPVIYKIVKKINF